MTYMTIDLRPPGLAGQRLNGAEARKIISAALRDPIPELFARESDSVSTGENRTVNPVDDPEDGAEPWPIVFEGGSGYLRVSGIGSRGVDLLTRHAMTIIRDVAAIHGAVAPRIQSGPMRMTPHSGKLYFIKSLVIAKKTKHFQALRSDETGLIDFDASRPRIERAILRGLASQAALLDRDGGTSFHLNFDPERCGLLILEGGMTLKEVKPGFKVAAAINLRFALDFNLVGPWVCGQLRNAGFGLIHDHVDGLALRGRSDRAPAQAA